MSVPSVLPPTITLGDLSGWDPALRPVAEHHCVHEVLLPVGCEMSGLLRKINLFWNLLPFVIFFFVVVNEEN